MFLFPIPGSAAPPSKVFVAAIDDTTSQTTYTFSGANLGTPAAGRKIVVVASSNNVSNTQVSSATIDGNAADLRIQRNFYSAAVCILDIEDASASSGDIVIVWAGGKSNCSICVYNVFGFATGAPDDTGTSRADPAAPTLTIPAGGVCIGGSVHQSATVTNTWVNLTEDADTAPEAGVCYSCASDIFAAEQSELAITVDVTTGTNDAVTIAYAVA
jgi:hypothetical protein